jgi:3-hydroxyisobutyrate dehydrogenase
MKVAVIGLGLMGCEMALRLKRQGREVIGWNRGGERALAAAERGLKVVGEVAEAIEHCELAILALSDGEAITQTLFANAAHARMLRGRILLQTGTIAPGESRELAERAAGNGARYLEAPVLGSVPEAREGRLILMAGGDAELFQTCRPLLEDLSRDPRLIGPVGQGAALKLAMNQLIAGLTATFALSLGLVRGEGIPVETFMGLLRESALYAKTFDKKLPNYLEGSYGAANFPLKHLLKDIRLFRAVALSHGLDPRMTEAMEAVWSQALEQGLGDLDYSAVYQTLSGQPESS